MIGLRYIRYIRYIRHILSVAVLNRDAGTNFDPAHYAHRAIYRRDAQQIEMHLDLLKAQRVNVPGVGVLELAQGDSIRTEISRKFTAVDLEQLCAEAGLHLAELWTTPEPYSYSLVFAQKR